MRATWGQEITKGRSLGRYHKRLNEPPFAIGQLPVWRPRGDTRRTPEQGHEEDERRAAETAEGQTNSEPTPTSQEHHYTNTRALPNPRVSGANQVPPRKGTTKIKPSKPENPAVAKIPTPTHTGALYYCACPPPLTLLT